MGKRTVTRREAIRLIAGVPLAAGTAGFSGTSAAATTLRMVAYTASNDASVDGIKRYRDMVNAKSGGELIINYVGGPEVIPIGQQAEAARSGAVDIAFNPLFQAILPEWTAAQLSEIKPWDERKNGFNDFLNELLNKQGLFYLGRQNWGFTYSLWVNREAKTPADLAGIRVRNSTIYEPIIKLLGGSPISIGRDDQYSALERGLLDGTIWQAPQVMAYAMYQVIRYNVGPAFFNASNEGTIVNLKKWNSLPKHLQDLLLSTQIELEPILDRQRIQEDAQYYKDAYNKGVKRIEWSASDTGSFLKNVKEACWKQVETVAPRSITKLKQLLTK